MNIRRIQLLSCLGLASLMLFWLDSEPTAAAVAGLVTMAMLFVSTCRQAWARRSLASGNLLLIAGLSLHRIARHPDLWALYAGITLWSMLLTMEIWQLAGHEQTGARLHRQRLTASLSALLGVIPFCYGLRLVNLSETGGWTVWLLGALGVLVCFGAWMTIADGPFRYAVLYPGIAIWLGILLGGALFLATAATQVPLPTEGWAGQFRDWLPTRSAGERAQKPPIKRGSGQSALGLDSISKAGREDLTPRVFLMLDGSDRDQQTRPPFYLRRGAYDLFTGIRWQASEDTVDWFEDADDGNTDGWISLAAAGSARTVMHGVFIPRQSSHEMLSLPNPIALGVPILMRGPDDSFLIPAREGQDIAYAVKSSWSTYAEVTATNPVAGRPGNRYLQLPSMPIVDRLRADAQAVVQGRRSAGDRIDALLSHMQRNYEYSEDVRGPRSLARFVAGEQAGHCTLHATVFAILLRSQNIPVRMATGFYGGRLDRASGVYFFTNADRHAWTEVYFQNYGWVIIDATPAVPGRQASVADSGFGERMDDFSFLGTPRVEMSSMAARGGSRGWNPSQFAQQGWAGFILALVLGSLILMAWLGLHWRQGKPPVVLAASPFAAIPDFYRSFCKIFARAGHPRKAGQTPREYVQSLKDDARIGPEFDPMVEYLYATRYDDQPRSETMESGFCEQVKSGGIHKP